MTLETERVINSVEFVEKEKKNANAKLKMQENGDKIFPLGAKFCNFTYSGILPKINLQTCWHIFIWK